MGFLNSYSCSSSNLSRYHWYPTTATSTPTFKDTCQSPLSRLHCKQSALNQRGLSMKTIKLLLWDGCFPAILGDGFLKGVLLGSWLSTSPKATVLMGVKNKLSDSETAWDMRTCVLSFVVCLRLPFLAQLGTYFLMSLLVWSSQMCCRLRCALFSFSDSVIGMQLHPRLNSLALVLVATCASTEWAGSVDESSPANSSSHSFMPTIHT